MLGRILGGLRRQHLGALALFLTLGGTSYAAVTVDAGSVGSREIRNRSVKTRHPFRAVQIKTGAERGRYLHPDLYGKPSSASVIRPVTSAAQARGATRRPKLASER
jgi:hypothetical protein